MHWARIQQLGFSLLDIARYQPPRARRVLMISNAADRAVSNRASRQLVESWCAAGATNVGLFEFPRRLKLLHDLVDPLQPNARPELVHPLLEEMLVTGHSPLNTP